MPIIVIVRFLSTIAQLLSSLHCAQHSTLNAQPLSTIISPLRSTLTSLPPPSLRGSGDSPLRSTLN